MPPRRAPEDRILDLWAHGLGRAEIMDLVRRPSGQRYSINIVQHVLGRARKRLDPRAIYKTEFKQAGYELAIMQVERSKR